MSDEEVMSLVEACERLEAKDETLRELELKEIDARLLDALSKPSHLKSLALVFGVKMDGDLASALAKQTQLEQLELNNVDLTDRGGSHFAAMMAELTRLETVALWMRNWERGDEETNCKVDFLTATGKLPRLRTLEVVHMCMPRAEGAAEMLESSRTLETLSLNTCALEMDGWRRLGQALGPTTR